MGRPDGFQLLNAFCFDVSLLRPYRSSPAGHSGILDVMVGPTSNLVGSIPEFLIFDLPFFYPDFEAADKVMDGRVGDALFEKLDALDMVGLAYWDNGFRHMTNAVRPINAVDDVAGLNIRVIPNPLFIATFTALGANPVPLPYTELFTALETRAVDAQETPVGLIHSSRFYEVQDHRALTGHVYQRNLSRTDADRLIGLLEEEGMEVTRLSDEEMARMRETVAPVVEAFAATIGTDLVQQAREDMDTAN